jgi:hypothetical protein
MVSASKAGVAGSIKRVFFAIQNKGFVLMLKKYTGPDHYTSHTKALRIADAQAYPIS